METTIDIRRATRGGDGAGGKVETWANVASGLKARRRLYSRKSLDRLEEGAGVLSETRSLFVLYRTPFPSVRANDVIVEAGGARYTVLFARVYARSLQVDVRRLA